MARTTRSTKGSAATTASAKDATPASKTSAYTLSTESENPPKLFIIPKKASSEARIVTLQNPRYAKPTRYLVCPEAGFFEFTKISAPKTAPRSWLLESARGGISSSEKGLERGLDAQTTKGAEFYVATPIDPVFLVLPALAAKSGKSTDDHGKKRMFLSTEEHFDAVNDPSSHLSEILTWPSVREQIESRMAAVCDTVDAGDEQMFRLNETKLLEEILSKVKRISEKGLPKSMEEKFVTKALEAPILGIKSQPANIPDAKPIDRESASAEEERTSLQAAESADSQSTISSVETSASSVSEASTAATSISDDAATTNEVVNAMTASEEVLKLQRLRVAFDFICSSYIVPKLTEQLKAQISTAKDVVDFQPLDEYLAQLAKLRRDAAAARAPDYSRKRARDEDEDERLEKKRKKEEEDKAKKKNQSLGVKKLMKVNTTGMKKMSDFFKKK
ncbi:ribonuclease H2, subunit B [Podospora didyma]|uniref:Ribonuclease H2 subunit B n=1 Tax=Podospora didyma TaxID=330526 RepID=A0AAE0TW40_9PEZI|nr:ribonuclease H2, subunit B [Podospora didyma]